MHNAGDIWEAKIERKGTQDRASYVLWALDDELFSIVVMNNIKERESGSYGRSLEEITSLLCTV